MTPRTLLPYQSRWVADENGLKVIEKSRRIGLSWAEAYDSVMHAGAGAGNVYYQSYALDMTRGFISDCADWAGVLQVGADAVGETLVELDEGDKIPAFRLPLASGKEIVAMTSAPRAFRSKGRPGDRAIVDEATFVDDLAEVLKAAMAFRIWGGTVHILSTHNGEASPFNTLAQDIREGRRPGSLHTVTFADAIREGLGLRRFEVMGEEWAQQAEDEWVEETRGEYGEDAAEELDCIPSAGAGTWLSWAEIRAAEDEKAGDPECYAGGRTVIGYDVARRRDLAVMWVLELVGDVAWTREHVELLNVSFADQDAELDRLVDCYNPYRVAIDQTGMGEKSVEDAQRRYGTHRVEGVLMTGPARLEVATALKRRHEDKTIRIPESEKIRRDFRSIKRVGGTTGGPRLVADEGNTDGHADRFWAAALACAAAELAPAVYAVRRIDNHARLDHHRRLGRPGAMRMRGQVGAL